MPFTPVHLLVLEIKKFQFLVKSEGTGRKQADQLAKDAVSTLESKTCSLPF